ncbi:hypothetical protein ABBQ32_000665 [Trebouxia sp. C0010 RCD-2024]
MAASAAFGRTCQSALLRESVCQRPFRNVASKHATRPAFQRLYSPTRCQQTTAAPPAGLQMPPWTNSDQQAKALKHLQDKMATCSYGQPDEDTQKWFLRDRKLDADEAAQKLTDMLKWRQDFQADSITWDMVAKEAETGKAYLHEYKDVSGQPVIVIRSSLHVTGEYSLDDSKRLCVLILEKALKQLPEGQETVLGIFDLKGFKQKNGDLGFAAFLRDIFFTYYPKRLGQVLFVDAPWIFQPSWNLFKPLLGKYAGLVAFVNREELRDNYFTPQTVPDDFKQN